MTTYRAPGQRIIEKPEMIGTPLRYNSAAEDAFFAKANGTAPIERVGRKAPEPVRVKGGAKIPGDLGTADEAREAGMDTLQKLKAPRLKEAGWTEWLSFACWLAFEGVWKPRGKYYSQCMRGKTWCRPADFYHPADLVTAWAELPAREADALKAKWEAGGRVAYSK